MPAPRPSPAKARLLAAEIAEKQPRSIKYQITAARLPLAKDLGDFTFGGTPISAALVHDLARASSSSTSATSSWPASATAPRGRFFNVVDLVDKLEAKGRAGRQATPECQVGRRPAPRLSSAVARRQHTQGKIN
jgi:hypothetical protein